MITYLKRYQKILLPIGFTIFLLILRICYTGKPVYIFLASNLFLAWLPFMISNRLSSSKKLRNWQSYCLLCLWLLFFPNAPYIITDFLHLKERDPVPLWYDVLLLFSASFNGLMLGFLSVQNIDKTLVERLNKRKAKIFLIISFFLCAFGIYIGRFLRWNSWDVFFNTPELLNDIADRFLNPLIHFRTWLITALFGFFLYITYYSLTKTKNEMNNKTL